MRCWRRCAMMIMARGKPRPLVSTARCLPAPRQQRAAERTALGLRGLELKQQRWRARSTARCSLSWMPQLWRRCWRIIRGWRGDGRHAIERDCGLIDTSARQHLIVVHYVVCTPRAHNYGPGCVAEMPVSGQKSVSSPPNPPVNCVLAIGKCERNNDMCKSPKTRFSVVRTNVSLPSHVCGTIWVWFRVRHS